MASSMHFKMFNIRQNLLVLRNIITVFSLAFVLSLINFSNSANTALAVSSYLEKTDYTLTNQSNGDFENQKYKDVLSKILDVCAKQKMACGIHVVQPDTQMLNRRISEGYTFIAYGVDTVFLNHGATAPK